jgi:hypothetical protein
MKETTPRKRMRVSDALILGGAAYLIMWLVVRIGMAIDRLP